MAPAGRTTGRGQPVQLRQQSPRAAAGPECGRLPGFFAALHSGRAIDAQNAWEDPRTRELADSHLRPLGIQAILDAGVRIDGELVGVLCLEHSNGIYVVARRQIGFAGELADLYAQIIISQQHRQASQALYLFKRCGTERQRLPAC